MFDFKVLQPTHKLAQIAFVLLIVFVTICGVQPAYAQANTPGETAGSYQTTLLRFAEGTPLEKRDALIAGMGGELVTWMPQINVAEVRLPEQGGVMIAAAADGIV